MKTITYKPKTDSSKKYNKKVKVKKVGNKKLKKTTYTKKK